MKRKPPSTPNSVHRSRAPVVVAGDLLQPMIDEVVKLNLNEAIDQEVAMWPEVVIWDKQYDSSGRVTVFLTFKGKLLANGHTAELIQDRLRRRLPTKNIFVKANP